MEQRIVMASLFSSLGSLQCLRCMRRATGGCSDVWLSSTRQQVRGKKKLAKVTTIKVRLLENIPRYGRRGAIIPITAGRMRNEFYPKRMAEYVTTAQLRELGMQDVILERDSTFGIAQRQKATEEASNPEVISPIAVAVDLLKPEHAMRALSELLPPNIDFYRTPISTTAPSPQRHSPSIPTSSTISVATQIAVGPQGPFRTSLFGSVTTTDIVDNIRAILAKDIKGARVVLTPEDVSFVEEGEEKDRVKHLGIFEIDIRIKGTTDSVRRTIKVNAQG